MALVQVTRHEGRIPRVPRGTTPIVELSLEPHQHVVSVELKGPNSLWGDDPDRKTVDWHWTAYVATRLEEATGG